MAIRELLGDLSHALFVNEYFLRLPFSLPGTAAGFCNHAQWSTVERLLTESDADVLIVRDGRRWEQTRRPDADEARRLFESGYTLLVRHAERHDPALKALADSFAEDFHAAVDVHIYCTPAGRFGFGWHYDAEDVFILQAGGIKEYSLRKNTVNPWPVVETLPADMRYERELMPLMKCRLKAGDWLYIPHGYWHTAVAEEDAVSLAVGVMMPTALDLFDFLRPALLDSIRWRQRLPVTGTAASLPRKELEQRFAEIARELASELHAALENPAFISAFLKSLDQRESPRVES